MQKYWENLGWSNFSDQQSKKCHPEEHSDIYEQSKKPRAQRVRIILPRPNHLRKSSMEFAFQILGRYLRSDLINQYILSKELTRAALYTPEAVAHEKRQEN